LGFVVQLFCANNAWMTNSAFKKLNIAILGTRGIPARYGGFETFAEELATILTARGHDITVYARRAFFENKPKLQEYKGIKVRVLPTVMHKYLETPLHAFFSLFHVLFCKFDVILLCNAANSPFAWLPKIKGLPIAINVDGIERKRAKWNALGKLWYLLGEKTSVWFATKVIADAKVIFDYYKEKYGICPEVIAYGARANVLSPGNTLKKFNLTPRKYILYVSRLEPENNALGVIEAYNKLNTDMPLVIVGDAPYAKDYVVKLHATACSRVVFTGYQFAEAYHELQSNCYFYIQATEVGGTHPALIEAMAYQNCVVANGTPENVEVLGDAGLIYSKNNFEELSNIMHRLLNNSEEVRHFGALAKTRANAVYSWDRIADQYEALFYSMVSTEAKLC
jgi:glycosyltransferase involved in cell wall biosynthesis